MRTADYIVVGSGLTGSTIARLLADAGRDVIVLERRDHVGGNVYDWVHASGIRVHTYGPHYFRTSSPRIWEFVNRFDRFYRYEAHLLSSVDGRFEHWPIVSSYIAQRIGEHWSPPFTGIPSNFEEACLVRMPALVYEKFIKEYTEKQWGVPVTTLSNELAGRFDVRVDSETRLSRHEFQGLPRRGYHYWMQQMLDGIEVHLGIDYLQERSRFIHRKRLVNTGPIDEMFDCALGKLRYRSQQRAHAYFRGESYLLPCGQVNYPRHAQGRHVRLLEWKHMMSPEDVPHVNGTVITSETPVDATDPESYEYPFPDALNQNLYKQYAAMAATMADILVCGRLGEYRYYDMDQAIGRAMKLATEQLLDAEFRVGVR